MPAALAVDWDAIKASLIAGVPAIEVAAQWGLVDEDGKPDTQAIRKRSSREQWPIPSAIMDRVTKRVTEAKSAHAQALAMIQGQKAVTNTVTVSPGAQFPTNPIDKVVDSVEKYGQRVQMSVLSALVPQIESAMRDTPESFRPHDLKTLSMGVGITAKLTGLDRPQQSLTVNFSGLSSHNAQIQVREAQVVEDEEDREE